MLNIQLISWIFKKSVKTGLYLDYLSRLAGKLGILNLFIWASLYVSEKFVVEYCTRFVSNHHKPLFTGGASPLYIFKITISWVVLAVLLYIIL